VIRFSGGIGQGESLPDQRDTLFLKAESQYEVEVILLDESKDPALVMSDEVEEEGEEHQIFFVPSDLDLTVEYADADEEGRPIGLRTSQVTGAAGRGNLRVVLKHQPGLKNESSTLNTGETDVDVTFPALVR
jgi:hypothetical protein